jgi:hypothetical protein
VRDEWHELLEAEAAFLKVRICVKGERKGVKGKA